LGWQRMAKRKGPFGLIHTVLCCSPEDVRPLVRPRLRWEDHSSKDVELVESDDDWRVLAEDRERWRGTCMSVWS